MRILVLPFIGLMLFVFVSGCVIPTTPSNNTNNSNYSKTGFCGTSTYGQCSADTGCARGGCSNQVCHSTNETAPITTCEYAECYSAGKYGVECACINEMCQWN